MKALLQTARPAALLLFLGLMALAPGRVAALGGRYIDIIPSGYAGSAPLTNFPLLVRLSTAITNFSYTQCRPDGADLAFYGGHDLLAHEIDTWDTNGTSLVWVRVPELTTNTTIHLVFGNPADVAPAFTTNGTVWADGYRAVWHLDDGTANNNILDSTANRFGGVKKAAGSPAETNAVVGKGQMFASNYINLTGLKDTGTSHTISMWVKASSSATGQYFFDVETGRFMLGWGSDTAGKIGLYRTSWVDFGSTPSSNVWHHIAVCCGGTDAKLYVDGALYGVQGAYSGVGFNGQVALGSRYSRDQKYFAGLLDEVRVSSVLRSPDWIRATYSNTIPNTLFNAYSAVDSIGSTLQIVGRPSDYGVADPVFGLHEGLENGHTYTCSVSRIWNDATEGIRYLCTGWTRYGIDRDTFEETLLGEAATNELVYTHTDIERLEWDFAQQYMIALTAGSGGSVSTTGDWYTVDSRVTVTATPSNGYAFVRWEGDVPQSVVDPYSARISFLADQPYELTAVFKPEVTYCVATTGLDSNDGSESHPFATLTNAVAKATVAYNSANAYTIIIEDGVYTNGNIQITVPLTIKSRNGLDSVTLVDSIVIGANTGSTAANVALYLNADGIVLDGLLFRPQIYPTGNTSSGPGRAITADKRAIIRNCAVRNWQTAGYSVHGIVYLAGGSVFVNGEMINCIVRSSGGQPRHGIIYVGGNASVIDTVITNCSLVAQTSSSGSAIYAAGTAVGSLLVRNSLIARCTSNRSGSTDMTLGGAIYLSGANMKAVLENVTLADCNDIGLGVGGLNVAGVASVAARNVLFHGNRNTATVKDVRFAAGMDAKCQFDNCAFTESLPVGVSGTGNVAVYEPFVGGGDYHLVSSPAVEAGANLDWALDAEARDLGGAPRLDASRVDIGCYEKDLAAIECYIVEAYNTGAFEPATFTYSAHIIGTNAYGLTYTWTLSGSAADTLSGAEALSYANTLPGGEYVLSLCVTNGDGTVVSAPTPRTISVFSDSIYVSLSGSETIPYNTPAKGFRTLGAAIAYAADGQTILLTSGTYPATNQLTVAKAVTIRSVTGDPGDVVFAPPTDASYIYTYGTWLLINNASAIVRDLTFSNIWVRAPGGYAFTKHVEITAGTLRNCRLQNLRGGGGAWQSNFFLYLNGANALAERCVVEGCRPYSVSYFVVNQPVNVNIGTFRNSVVRGNWGFGNVALACASSAKIYNNTVVGNTTTEPPPGYLNYTLDNNLFAGTALYSSSSTVGLCQNNVFMNNRNELDFIGHTQDYTYVRPSCMSYTFSDNPAGSSPVGGDPVFRDPKNGDYRIMPGSCLVGAGSVIASVTNDFTGAARASGALTVGAYELPDEFCCGFTFTAENNVIGSPIAFKGYVHDPEAAPAESYTHNWAITREGNVEPALVDTRSEFTTSALAAGRYSVSLTVTRASDSATAVFSRAPAYLYVGPSNVYVNPASENPVFPYSTAATAARDLAEACDTVVAPGTVHLSAGTHYLSKQLFILKAVTMTGQGYDRSIVCQTGTAHRVLYIGHKNAVVEKIGITGGNRTTAMSARGLYPFRYVGSQAYACGGGVFIPSHPERAGTMRDCRLFGDKYAGYWGGQLHAAGGLVERCVIDGTASLVNAAYGGGVMLSGTATIRNSLISGNRASTSGGGLMVYYPTVVRIINCTITDNFVTNTTSSTASGPGLYIAQGPENHPGRVEVVNTVIHGNHLSAVTPAPEPLSLTANPDFFESQYSKAYVTIPFINNLTSFETTGYEADKLFSTNSLAADPLFKRSGTIPFKPLAGSPCIDNGLTQEWMHGTTDLIGQRRVFGGKVDIGAYEARSSSLIILR